MIDAETRASIEQWASAYADKVHDRFGYPKEASICRILIEGDKFQGRYDLLLLLWKSPGTEVREALDVAVEAIAAKPGWKL